MIIHLKNFLYRKKKIQLDFSIKVSEEDFDKFIYNWNIENSVDRWYRQKYGIKFNSPEHRVLSFIDMAFEWRENKLYESALEEKESTYKLADYLKIQEIKQEDLPSDEELMKLDFSKFDN